ncbi:MAG: metal ABC transporter substrate-binding protein [Chloroflexi bacterium]|nr:metal ABC transporter substrate-binding protein [Chloroflexota bacterium]MCI0578506.1 metal ABC transporter substrate-binding protein [Chloroflexota bacterium]MCI0648477.1 metal ABC transporter substrate-binding protein [Chloroflexota bacterium]MCI0726001.1 metal ABC transporter substrate-binding protein [Chloroflexota bacterium]
MRWQQKRLWSCLLFTITASLLFVACNPSRQANTPAATEAPSSSLANPEHEAEHEEGEHDEELAMLTLPEVAAVDLGGRRLRVVATTTIIGDVVAQVGGEAIELTVLIGPAQDSHSYEPSAADLASVAEADVVFVNGWNLEEGLLASLENAAEDTPLAPVSANIEPLAASEAGHEEEAGEEHGHGAADPHTWLDPHNVLQWVANIEQVLRTLDPANAETYANNARAYLAEVEELIAYYDEQVAQIPAEQRKLVTNHDAFGYFAAAYGFEIIGTVIPATSTLAEPSASGLAQLAETMRQEGVCALFAESTANDELARTVAAEVETCRVIQVLTLYTEALGETGSYLGMMRANIEAMVAGLGQS